MPEVVCDVDITELVRRIIEEREEAIRDKGIKLYVDRDLGTVTANPTHVYQVFANIIGNAINHNESVNPAITVSRLGQGDGGGTTFLIRDNGSGIPPEHLDRVFEPFYKGEGGASGLGLAIVKNIVTVYDGDVRAYNDDGACFEFTFRGIAV